MVYFEKVRDAENLSSHHCLFFPSSLQHPCEHLPKVEDGAGLLPPPFFCAVSDLPTVRFPARWLQAAAQEQRAIESIFK